MFNQSPIYSVEVKERAHRLYLEGKPPREVSNIINREFEIQSKPSLISSWSKNYKWDLELATIKTQALVPVAKREIETLNNTTDEQITAYRKLWKKSEENLDNLPEGGIKVKNARDLESVAKALDVGLQGEQKIRMGVLKVQFIQDILSVLTEEIKDEMLLRRIALRLKRVAIAE